MTEVATQAPDLPKQGKSFSPRTPKKKAAPVSQPSQAGDVESNVHEATGTQKSEPEYETVTNGDAEEGTQEEEGDEAIQAGSVDEEGNIIDEEGNVIGHVTGDISKLKGNMVDQEGDVLDPEGNVIGKAEIDAVTHGDLKPDLDTEGVEKPDVEHEDLEKPELAAPFGVQDNGEITNATGDVVGKLAEGTPQDLVGTSIKEIDAEGNLKAESGSTIGKAELSPELLEKAEGAGSAVPDEKLEGASAVGSQLGEGQEKLGSAVEGSQAPDAEKLGEGVEGSQAPDAEKLGEGVEVPEDAEKLGEEAEVPEDASKLGEGVEAPEDAEKLAEGAELPDLSILKGKKVNKLGKIVDEEGTPFGQLLEGDPKKLVGKKVDAEGKIWDDSGKVIGVAELLPEDQREAEPSAPFEDFPDSVLDKSGNVIFEGKVVGKLIEGDAKKLEGKKVDADGDVLDKNGNVLGKAERYQEEEAIPEPEPEPEVEDLSILEGKKVNKAGNVVDDFGKLFGKVSSGDLSKLIGKKVDAEGKIWSESGKVIGTAELIPADDRDAPTGAPFEDFPDAIVDKHGNILFEGQIVGKLIEGDAKKLVGKKIDPDGEIVDKIGNVLGRAERWIEEDEPEPEPVVVDNSALAGKRVNKLGNVVDSHGSIFGHLVEGDPKKLAGRMCDKNGNVMSEDGTVIGKAELVPESEREGAKEGPFVGFASPTVTKDGKVADAKGVIIGRLTEGDAKKLYGKMVDPDGDVLDNNGNVLGKAERWEEEEKQKTHNPVAGRKVNKDGNVVDENGDIIAKLTEGAAIKCSGKEIDEDGDVYNLKGQVIGHVTLLEDLPEPEAEPVPEEPKESEEEIEKRKQLETDKKLAGQMAMCISGCLDKIDPILKMITDVSHPNWVRV
jgi:hypothetical protein